MSGATPGILQDRSLTGRCLTDTPRLPEAFGHMIPSMFCSTGYSPIWCKIAASSDEVKPDVSRHSSFVQSHHAVFKLRWDGWVDGSFRTSLPVCWVGLTATTQPIGIGAGLQVQGHTPLPAARSSPLVGPTLAWPHASLPPASLLQLPTSVITPHPVSAFIHHRRIAPVPSLIKKLRTLQVLLYRPFVLLYVLLCPRHGAVWSETSCCLSTQAIIYRARRDPIIVGHDCLPPASSPGLSHA